MVLSRIRAVVLPLAQHAKIRLLAVATVASARNLNEFDVVQTSNWREVKGLFGKWAQCRVGVCSSEMQHVRYRSGEKREELCFGKDGG